jgi:hypothetical protein
MDERTLLKKIDELCLCVGLDISVPGVLRPLPLAGVKARLSTLQSPLTNLVGMAVLDEEHADENIEQILAYYRQEEKIFGWLVGPTSQPTDLGNRLVTAGLTRVEEEACWGMVLRDLHHTITVNSGIRVEQVTLADWDAHLPLMVRAYGALATLETFHVINRFYEFLGEHIVPYFAYAPQQEEPVAFSVSHFDHDERLVCLSGAATLMEYRGRGVYSAMVAKRLDDARARGITSAIIQANQETSAPICLKLGFEIVCPIDFYVSL